MELSERLRGWLDTTGSNGSPVSGDLLMIVDMCTNIKIDGYLCNYICMDYLADIVLDRE